MTMTCATDVIALALGLLHGGCTWLAIYLWLQMWPRGQR